LDEKVCFGRFAVNMLKSKKVVLGVLTGLLLALGLHAATTGTLTLSGSQPAILQITVTANAAAGTLTVNSAVVDLLVGTIVEQSNDTAGYTVTLSSANGKAGSATTATLKGTPGGDLLPYSIKYGGVAVVFHNGEDVVVSNVSSKTVAAGSTKTVTISFDGTNANLGQAVYTDSLTFAIIAK
jgi:hypothetical protein